MLVLENLGAGQTLGGTDSPMTQGKQTSLELRTNAFHRARARKCLPAPGFQLLSFSRETAHKCDQALDLFLGEIKVRRHGSAFTDSGSSALNNGPNSVVGSGSLPVCVRQILRSLS